MPSLLDYLFALLHALLLDSKSNLYCHTLLIIDLTRVFIRPGYHHDRIITQVWLEYLFLGVVWGLDVINGPQS